MATTVNDLVTAQNALNASIKEAVEAFLSVSPDFSFNYCNVQNTIDTDGVRGVAVDSTVEASIDGARISRSAPRGV